MEINTQTQLCGVLGNPVAHSLSPAIHNAAFQHLSLNFVYLAFQVEDIAGALTGMRSLGNFRGVSITIPHKVAAIPLVDHVETTAQHIGAINTIVKEGNRLQGYNTDAPGALRAIREANIDLEGQQVVLAGSGGAARAIAFGLAIEEKLEKLTILGIDDTERARLVQDLRTQSSISIEEGTLSPKVLTATLHSARLLIHCTPIGMYPHIDSSCIPGECLPSHLAVMDIVYNPLETKLLRDAARAGCHTIRGVDMFLYQAVAQFELWTGHPAPVGVMRSILESHMS